MKTKSSKRDKRVKGSKMGRRHVFLVDVHPYKQQCVVVCNGQFSDAVSFFKKCGTDRAEEILRHIEQDKESYADNHKVGGGSASLFTELPHGYVMLLSHTNNWKETVGLVVHESLHLTHYILRRAGVELSKESEEAFTYLQESIVGNILKAIY